MTKRAVNIPSIIHGISILATHDRQRARIHIRTKPPSDNIWAEQKYQHKLTLTISGDIGLIR